jgi:hypothetical protein
MRYTVIYDAFHLDAVAQRFPCLPLQEHGYTRSVRVWTMRDAIGQELPPARDVVAVFRHFTARTVET